MTRHFLYVFVFLMAQGHLSAQCSKKAEKFVDKAKTQLTLEQDVAIENLNKALELCPKDEQIIFLLADLYRQKDQPTEVRRVLYPYVEQGGSIDQKASYFLAEAEQDLFLFDDAAKHYRQFLASESTSRKLNYRAQKRLKDVLFAAESYPNAHTIEFTPLASNINTESSEYLPIMTADEKQLVFTRRESVAEEAYFTTLEEDRVWSNPQPLDDLPTNLRKAAVSISVDGNLLVFAMADHIQGRGNFDLYYMEREGAGWSQVKNFGPNVNTPGWESQPCVSADGRTVVFSTDRKGGEGGHDLWKTKREPDGTWMAPTNLGFDVNSPGNEESPFLHRDQRTLYFRSDGHPGLGDFDIFMSRMIRFKKWTTPVNLGYPVNTIGNDGSLFVSLDGTEAYIASDIDHTQLSDYKNQVDQGQTDIYQFELHEDYRPIPTTYIQLSFIEKGSQKKLHPYLELLDYQTGDTLYMGGTDEEGHVLLCLPRQSQYALSVVSEDHLPYFEHFEPAHRAWGANPIQKQVKLSVVPAKMVVAVSEPITLSNVLFETNSAILKPGSFHSLDRLADFLVEQPKVKILIKGHTDNVGDPDSNLVLSLNRAKAVNDYLVSVGIDADRLTFEGYGETDPVSDNETEEGRSLNRRTEFVLLR